MALRGATGGDGETLLANFDIRTNLRQVMNLLKEYEPKLSTEIRRRMRQSGDSMITAMGDLLDEYDGGVVTGKTYSRQLDRSGKRRRMVDQVNTREANRARSRGSREEIKAGLKTRVSTGVRRTSIRVTASKGELKRSLNTKSWRHPVFDGEAQWVEQPGNQYFNSGAYSEAQNLKEALEDAIHDALEALATHGIQLD